MQITKNSHRNIILHSWAFCSCSKWGYFSLRYLGLSAWWLFLLQSTACRLFLHIHSKFCKKHILHKSVFQCWVLNSRVGTFNWLGKQEKLQWKRNGFEICNGNESSLPYFQLIKEFKCI